MSQSQTIKAAQQMFQSAKGYVHMKSGGDKLTSSVIPLGLALTTGAIWAKGMWNLYCGTGKLE